MYMVLWILTENDDGIYVKGLIYIRMFIYNTLYIICIDLKESKHTSV